MGTTDPAVVPEPTDEQIDADLALDGFDPDEKYPEHPHSALRTAYRSGYEAALIVAGRDSRDGIVVPRELIERLTEPTRSAEDIIWRQNAIAELRLLAGHTKEEE